MRMKRILTFVLMALLLCLPVWAMADEAPTIIEKIEITVPEPKVGETFNPDAVTAAFTTDSSDMLSINDVAFVMYTGMFSSDTSSSDFSDWEEMTAGDAYEDGKHYMLLVEFYYEDFGARPDRFLTDSLGDVIAAKAINGKPYNSDAVQMYLDYWEYQESYDNAVVAYQWTLTDEPVTEPDPTPTPVPDSPAVPATGDGANLALWSALAIISLLGAMSMIRKRSAA